VVSRERSHTAQRAGTLSCAAKRRVRAARIINHAGARSDQSVPFVDELELLDKAALPE